MKLDPEMPGDQITGKLSAAEVLLPETCEVRRTVSPSRGVLVTLGTAPQTAPASKIRFLLKARDARHLADTLDKHARIVERKLTEDPQ